jgi:hypothetical protein
VSLTPPGESRSPLRRGARQLSLFGVEATDPGPADLAGLLAGPGQLERMGGTARVSVVVDAAWRVHVLAAELAARGLAASWLSTVDDNLVVRTAYTTALAPLGAAWMRPRAGGVAALPRFALVELATGAGTVPIDPLGVGLDGAVKRPPPGFYLDGPRLRLWVAAAGTAEPLGFLLRLGPSDEASWDPVGAALAAIGLPAVLVGPRNRAGSRVRGPSQAEPIRRPRAGSSDEPGRHAEGSDTSDGVELNPGSRVVDTNPEAAGGPVADSGTMVETGPGPARPVITGPAFRITGRRRLARLAELVGERPAAAPLAAWPGSETAGDRARP